MLARGALPGCICACCCCCCSCCCVATIRVSGTESYGAGHSNEQLTLCFSSSRWQIGKNIIVLLALYILILFVEIVACAGVGALRACSKSPLDIRSRGAGGGRCLWILVARVEVGSVRGGGGPAAGGVGAGHGRWVQQCRAQPKAKAHIDLRCQAHIIRTCPPLRHSLS